ncbi:MAG TPA: phenylacetic acid degradation operon negative regulatory protein PaaX [Steroidobacteraceae bacterium]|nr:phenylacetic acid degradation operon negative regulatory protein PaaX [Steroidobacteraceae bacterium]
MKKNLQTVAADLARLRSQQPLRGGSLIVTLFGDAILPRGGAISLLSLIALAAPFGLNERLVRTATARLVHEGWLRSRRLRKRSEYQLSAPGRERFAEATQRIYGRPNGAWSGRWTLVALPSMPSAQRRKLKKDLLWAGFGEIAPGTFAHPEVAQQHVKPMLGAVPDKARPLFFDAQFNDDDTPERLIKLGWDLEDLGRGYQRFVSRFAPAQTALQQSGFIPAEAAFVVRTLLIHEYRRLHLRDPMLPARLLPADWPGTLAAEMCRDIYSRIFASSEKHLSATAFDLEGPLPPPDRSVEQRFGGLRLPKQ